MSIPPYEIVATPQVDTVTRGASVTYAAVIPGRGHGADPHAYRDFLFHWYLLPERGIRGDGRPQSLGTPDARGRTWRDVVWNETGRYAVLCEIKRRARPEQSIQIEYPQTVAYVTNFLHSRIAAREHDDRRDLPDIYRALASYGTYMNSLRAAAVRVPIATPAKQREHEQDLARYRSWTNALGDLLTQRQGRPAYTYKVNAIHVATGPQETYPLNVFINKRRNGTWALVDWTNPLDRSWRVSPIVQELDDIRRLGTDRQRVEALIGSWTHRNRYPVGYVRYHVYADAFGTEIEEQFPTTGETTADTWSRWLDYVGTGAAIAAGIITLIAPVPGSRVASALIWASLFSSSAAAVTNLAQRRLENDVDHLGDALDVLSLVGNIFTAGTLRAAAQSAQYGRVAAGGSAHAVQWARRGNVIAQNGMNMALFGQMAAEGASGVLLGHHYISQIEPLLNDSSLTPHERMQAVLRLLGEAISAGALMAVSFRGTHQDIRNMNRRGADGVTPRERLERLGDPNAPPIDLSELPHIDGNTAEGGVTVRVQEDHRRLDVDSGEARSSRRRRHEGRGRSEGGPRITPHNGIDMDRRTARTGGIESIDGYARLDGSMEYVIEGTLLEPLWRPPSGQPNVQPPPGRTVAPCFEKEIPLGSNIGLTDYQRAHLWGPGFGDEAADGIMYAPRQVNQEVQNRGIEGKLRVAGATARELGGAVRVRATARSHPTQHHNGSELLAEVEYEVSVVVPGRDPQPWMRVSISVDPPPSGRVVVEVTETAR